MTDREGALIVLEGTSNIGVAKQYELLSEKLLAEGHDVLELHFPQVDSESSYFVRQYLDDAFGPRGETSPYVASLYYALDKHTAARDIKDALAHGTIVLCTGYVSSVMASEGKKFKSPEERRGFFIWYDNVEHQMLGLPRPTRSLILIDPSEKGDSSTTQTDVYLDVCALFPKDFQRIDTVRNNTTIEADALHNQIWNTVSQLLPTKTEPSTTTDTSPLSEKTYIIPDDLPDEVKHTYIQTLDTILEAQQQVQTGLESHLNNLGDPNAASKALEVARLLLPASSKTAFTYVPKQTVQEGVLNSPVTSANSLRLLSFTPRNELDAARMILEEKGAGKTASSYDKLQYADKVKIIEDYISSKSAKTSKSNALDSFTYTFSLNGTFADYVTLASHATKAETDSLSPRLGFVVPDLLDDAGLTDQYEASFDASFALFSLMQKHGLHEQAQYATLLGHKLQATLEFTLRDIHTMRRTGPPHQLAEALDHLSSIHPLLITN